MIFQKIAESSLCVVLPVTTKGAVELKSTLKKTAWNKAILTNKSSFMAGILFHTQINMNFVNAIIKMIKTAYQSNILVNTSCR